MRCRFYADSDHVDHIQWVVCHPDAPLLGLNSAICNLCLEVDKQVYRNHVGEIWDGGRSATWITLPACITGDHHCGTDADFEQGQHYDPAGPVIPYGSEGWPLCCGVCAALDGGPAAGGYCTIAGTRVDPTEGGLSIGGSAGDQVVFTDAPSGGLELGGSAGDQVVFTDAPSGGLSIGGSAGDQYTPPAVTPGTNCPTAGVCSLDVTYGHTTTMSFETDWWVFPGLVTGVTYYVTTSNVGFSSGDVFINLAGGICFGYNFPTLNQLSTNCWSFELITAGFAYLYFDGEYPPAIAYTFKVSTTPC